jgi:hypothetical protein
MQPTKNNTENDGVASLKNESDQQIISMAENNQQIAVQYRQLYQDLYSKVSPLFMGGQTNLVTAPAIIRVIIETTMELVENYSSLVKLTGQEKRQVVLGLVKCVIAELSKDGKIDPHMAAEIIKNTDFWGGLAIDIAVDAAKMVFYIGVKIKEDVVEFANDAKKSGCKQACKDNCCCGLF